MKLRAEREHRLKLRYNPEFCDIGETMDSKTGECVIRHELTSNDTKCPTHEVFAETGKWKQNGKKHFIEAEACITPVYLSTGNSKVGQIPHIFTSRSSHLPWQHETLQGTLLCL